MLTVSGVRLTSVKFWGKVDSLEFPSLEGEARFLGALEVMPRIATLQREREREDLFLSPNLIDLGSCFPWEHLEGPGFHGRRLDYL